MTLEHLQRKHAQLLEASRAVATHLEQLKGALALCDELIREAAGNGVDPDAPEASPDVP
jgi:hypothetical protein